MDQKEKGKVLILGMGNILLGDEGVGVRAVEYIEDKALPGNVELLDGGTGGFTLLSEIQKFDHVILIDATLDENPIGTIRVIKPKFASDYPKAMSTHDIGLKDLIESASIMGNLPTLYLIIVTIKNIQPMDLNLSAEIKNKLPEVYSSVLEVLKIISPDQINQN